MKIFVCGAGTMGAGIAQVIAGAGHEVILRDVSEYFADNGYMKIKKNLERQVSKGKLKDEGKDDIIARITTTTELDHAKECNLVIEVITEQMEVKKLLFNELESICPPDVIFASNTSALSISELASATKRPDKFIGMHFFNPAPVMKLVEVTKGFATSEETFHFIRELAEGLGKSPVAVEEAPGFIVNRILIPMINEATFILMEGIASAEDIDAAMKLGANHPIGPLALADMIGLDVCLWIMQTLYTEFGDSKYRPCPLLNKMVRAGYLGRKTGKGFFNY